MWIITFGKGENESETINSVSTKRQYKLMMSTNLWVPAEFEGA